MSEELPLLRGAWDNEPVPITDPAHPTGIGTNETGDLVIGWGGAAEPIAVDLERDRSYHEIDRLIRSIEDRNLSAATSRKIAFLRDILQRRTSR